jgi:hypothetical protein
VHVILGNHEVMNLIGDLRYVVPADYAAFAADEREEIRANEYSRFTAANPDADSATIEARFTAAYPPGYFAREAAFAPSGRYGAWLLTLPTIVVINDTAYVHGGLPSLVAEQALDVNSRVRSTLIRYFELRDRLAERGVLPPRDRRHDGDMADAARATAEGDGLQDITEFLALVDAAELGSESPFWYRGSIFCKPLLEAPKVDAALQQLGVARAVVGHTPTADHRVRSLYDGKLVMLDTGMLAAYFAGRPAALVLEGGGSDVLYLAPAEHGTIERDYPLTYGLHERELREALERGTVTAVDRGDGMAPWRVRLRYEEHELTAIFIPEAGDKASDFELAAATLDDLLGTGLVAPTVARSIEGQQGALQLRYADTVSEAERVARGLSFSGWCPIAPQLQLLYTFDLLTMNRGRTTATVLLSNNVTDLTSTDYAQAFGADDRLPARFDPSTLNIPAAAVARLRALDEPGLRAALGRWLDSRRIQALLERRDRLLKE